eukprot:scaffold291955_cov32-Tisochrysis_lutea.AAC.1
MHTHVRSLSRPHSAMPCDGEQMAPPFRAHYPTAPPSQVWITACSSKESIQPAINGGRQR